MADRAVSRRIVEPWLLRDMNDRIHAVHAQVAAESAEDVEVEFLCECGDEACTATLSLTLSEYDALHWMPNCLLVAPGHELPWAGQVVSESGEFVVVESRETVGL
jgi:hypothetical protein